MRKVIMHSCIKTDIKTKIWCHTVISIEHKHYTSCKIHTQHWACMWWQCEYFLAKESPLWGVATVSGGCSVDHNDRWQQHTNHLICCDWIIVKSMRLFISVLLSCARLHCVRSQIRLENLEQGLCSTRFCHYWCHQLLKTRSDICLWKWLTAFSTNWMTWFGRMSIRYAEWYFSYIELWYYELWQN